MKIRFLRSKNLPSPERRDRAGGKLARFRGQYNEAISANQPRKITLGVARIRSCAQFGASNAGEFHGSRYAAGRNLTGVVSVQPRRFARMPLA